MNSNYKTDRSKFGGLIYDYDYYGHLTMSDIASRIVSDMKFDEKCKKNIQSKKNSEKEKQ